MKIVDVAKKLWELEVKISNPSLSSSDQEFMESMNGEPWRYGEVPVRYGVGGDSYTSLPAATTSFDGEPPLQTSKTAWWGYVAGKDLPDEIFGCESALLTKLVIQNSWLSYLALGDWSDEKIRKHKGKLRRKVSKSALASSAALKNLPKDRLTAYDERELTKGVATHPQTSLELLILSLSSKSDLFKQNPERRQGNLLASVDKLINGRMDDAEKAFAFYNELINSKGSEQYGGFFLQNRGAVLQSVAQKPMYAARFLERHYSSLSEKERDLLFASAAQEPAWVERLVYGYVDLTGQKMLVGYNKELISNYSDKMVEIMFKESDETPETIKAKVEKIEEDEKRLANIFDCTSLLAEKAREYLERKAS